MPSKTRSTPVDPSAPGVITDRISQPVSNSPVATDPDAEHARPSPATGRETRRERSRRRAHRFRLHGYAILAVVLVAFLIALAATNTAAVRVHWVFGSSHVALVWLVLAAAILGWLLGLVATGAFHWRTRAPRRGGNS